MKTIVCVIVHSRFKNLIHWLECWQKCVQDDAQLVIIHNMDKWDERFVFLTVAAREKYIGRVNIGYDIGAFQDLCKGRLKALKEWERVLWVTDDVFPCSLDFVKQFNDAMTEGVGVTCMEISQAVKPHIRTSGFMIDKTVAERLKFPADPVTTKRQCYEFEHMGSKAFYEQIIRMGLKVVQVAPNNKSPLWDSGYARKLDRRKEHEAIFGRMPEQPPFIPKSVHLMNEK